MLISNATKTNWNRLNTSASEKKLDSRANKRLSNKRIIPIECFSNPRNLTFINKSIDVWKESNVSISDCIYSLCINYLIKNQLLDKSLRAVNENIQNFVQTDREVDMHFASIDLPQDETNILGIIYQCILTEGQKNQQGSYYTPKSVVDDMLKNIALEDNKFVLDPCCGSGMFLTGINAKNPSCLYGFDVDPIAVMIAKTNLFVKYCDTSFSPNIYCIDFLKFNTNKKVPLMFDYIVTNPPWGAMLNETYKPIYPEIVSGESFSYFIVKAKKMLKESGKLKYLLPESFLNVKTHKDIREYILKKGMLENITLYPNSFTGVITKFISITASNESSSDYEIEINDFMNCYTVNSKKVIGNHNCVISLCNPQDEKILQKVFEHKYATLDGSQWALGIVTGDNKNKIKTEQKEGYEPVYTGKEICQYKLLPYKKYVLYDRLQLQQVAPDEIYRSPEKLAYKFISKKLTFAYDDTKSLFINSANILIPKIKGISIKTVLAFLNSSLYQYIYMKKFGEIKILKGNLMQLPFPIISEEVDKEIADMVDLVLQGERIEEEIDDKIFNLFDINKEEKAYIKGILYSD